MVSTESIIGIIGIAVSLSSVVLILLTYKWNQMPSPSELETRLQNRLANIKIQDGDFIIDVKEIRVREEQDIDAYVRKYLLFDPVGVTTVSLLVRTESNSFWPANSLDAADELWSKSDMEEYNEAFDLGPDQAGAQWEPTRQKEYDVRIRLAVESLDAELIYDYVGNISRLITGTDVQRPTDAVDELRT